MGYLKDCLDLGLYVSFACNVTYPNAARLKEFVFHTPIEKMVVETDAPFLPPQPHRGKRNEPSYLRYLVDTIAAIKGLSAEQVERTTTENAARLFGLTIGR